MDLYEYLLGPGTRTDSNLCLIQEFTTPHEIDHLEMVQLHQHHLRNLDLTKEFEPPEGALKPFPTIRLVPLAQLLKAIKSSNGPQNDRIWPPGSRMFGKRLLKAEKSFRATEEAISLHHERISTLSYSLLAAEQESVGVASETLLIKLRYHLPEMALKTLECDPFQNRTWTKGLERPTPECRTLVVRGEGADAYHFALFNLTA